MEIKINQDHKRMNKLKQLVNNDVYKKYYVCIAYVLN